MINDHVGSITDTLKQDLALESSRNQNKVISILSETDIYYDQIHYIRNNWLGPIFVSSGDSHTKGLLVLLHLILEGITEFDTDLKGRFVRFKITSSNDRALWVYAPWGYSTREQLGRGRFFQGLQIYMKNKNEGNENKIIFGYFNCTMDQMDKDGKNKTQRLYRCCSNYALLKLIMDNGLEDLWRMKNPDVFEFTCYGSSFGKDSG